MGVRLAGRAVGYRLVRQHGCECGRWTPPTIPPFNLRYYYSVAHSMQAKHASISTRAQQRGSFYINESTNSLCRFSLGLGAGGPVCECDWLIDVVCVVPGMVRLLRHADVKLRVHHPCAMELFLLRFFLPNELGG
jgi:hypothetical protein